ncbi:MAG: D-alanine--D-alanine ligase A, partial [bacterium]|nr:D-alanine--D-alanine ligase A [bacterium]
MKRVKVLVLFGGKSAEHEISVQSATSIIEAIDTALFEVIPVGISKSGRWCAPVFPQELLRRGFTAVPEPDVQVDAGAIGQILNLGEVVFPVLHGPFGEDGSMQGLLEIFDKPYVGAGVIGSALGMDKIYMKMIFKHLGLPIAKNIS